MEFIRGMMLGYVAHHIVPIGTVRSRKLLSDCVFYLCYMYMFILDFQDVCRTTRQCEF